MRELTLSPSDIQYHIEHGRFEGRCIHLISTNPEWDKKTNYHVTDWAPVRVKKSFYDEVEGSLNLEPFVFSDNKDDLKVRLVSGSDGRFEYSLISSKFEYKFRECVHEKEGTGVSSSDGNRVKQPESESAAGMEAEDTESIPKRVLRTPASS